ncbi:unnamed protein product [Rotaria magnacalcarata]|uniref:Uncharacterized protein n=1 Tax=Rotaria magnacalcarata TaxID=392030 RepID=A0A816UF57_9BILA|nr:unnamed protein product [Rotaria magnacalcarata]CAF2110374.1 unnamed protein product [Rotaria magnacalcarata]CAF3886355.1 unnamed protein product [Rotaria magnacalcarata]CAF3921326.1 unnamed protein product [Rotaria magnacalcarata]
MGNRAARRPQPNPVPLPYTTTTYFPNPGYQPHGHRPVCHRHPQYYPVIMDKIANPYLIMLERLQALDQSIYILNLVNSDLRQILQKQKPLPQFIHDSFKRSTTLKSKSAAAIPPLLPLPMESEEILLAASIIDKAKRTIENVSEKKTKLPSTGITTATLNRPKTTQTNRPKTSSTIRPSSASSTIPSESNSSLSQQQNQQQQPIRRYVPAHMKAPFLTQAEVKRRPNSSTRSSSQANLNKNTGSTVRSNSQQRQQSSSKSSTRQSAVKLSQHVESTLSIHAMQCEKNSIIDNRSMNEMNDEKTMPDQESAMISTEEPIYVSNETNQIDPIPIPQPIMLNQALIKPLRRLWKQNQNLRTKLEFELNKKSLSLSSSSSSPAFIDRLNEKIHSSSTKDTIIIPNIEVLLQLVTKIRLIVLYLLEKSTFNDLNDALKRLNTLKYLVNQYFYLFTSNINVFVTKYDYRPSNINTNVDEWSNKPMSRSLNRKIIHYTDDSELIAFTEVRFKQFENECRWIELNWHEQMIIEFKQSLSNTNLNPLQIYRELMCLVTGLQTSTPIVVENKYE